jgi:adenosylhomocysteine nucleosidase
MSEQAEVLIVTALKLEREAVRAHLGEVEVEQHSGLACDVGLFDTCGSALRVAVLQTGAGNVAAAIATTQAEEHFLPALLVMVGIAGGLKDVGLGDVVASEKVYWVEGGKLGGREQEEWFPRVDFAPVSNSLCQLARAVAADGHWRNRLPERADSVAWVAPIAAGEKVLANSDAAWVRQLRRHCSDAVCVDMEDYGTVRAGNAAERARTLAVRGISDLIDDKGEVEEHGSQEVAAARAGAFSFELIAQALRRPAAPESQAELAALFAQLYPEGPLDQAIWERAGGDPSGLELQGNGRERWWRAVGSMRRGTRPSVAALVAVMRVDYPENGTLRALERAFAA